MVIELQARYDENLHNFQERIQKMQEDYGEITRNDQINFKVKLEQKYEMLSQSFNKKSAKLEDELKNDLEAIKMEFAEVLVKLERVYELNPNTHDFQQELNDKFEKYDNSFKNIMENFSSLNLTWLKLQNEMNTQNKISQESFKSVWDTIGLMNQQLFSLESKALKGGK